MLMCWRIQNYLDTSNQFSFIFHFELDQPPHSFFLCGIHQNKLHVFGSSSIHPSDTGQILNMVLPFRPEYMLILYDLFLKRYCAIL